MFFKKDEKAETKTAPAEGQAPAAAKPEEKAKTKVIYRIEDRSGQGEWTINRAEVPREQQLAVNEFPKILAAQRAVFEDLSARMKKLKEVRTRVKAIRKAAVAAS